ncbi:MAG: D-(-)-3-hydroxybutyrate oligomer hydrolase [Wenzhouxiangellaceae bacterium]
MPASSAMQSTKIIMSLAVLLSLSACQQIQTSPADAASGAFRTVQQIERSIDDLVSSGLGVAGIQGSAPAVDAPEQPDPLQLRRLAIYNNYRALQDVSGSGFGDWHGPLRAVPGTEILARRQSPLLQYPHAVALQLPDSFDPAQPCLVVSAASGSRGVYGAAAVTGDWALIRACAVVYTDKGAGTGFFDFASGEGIALDGTPVTAASNNVHGYLPASGDRLAAAQRVAIKHAHSGDNPEAHWGVMVLDAARFAISTLRQRYPAMPRPLTIAAGISNGGAAVLRAAEQDRQRLIDAVVAAEPNIYPPAAAVTLRSGSQRIAADQVLPMYAYATQLGLYQPCAVLHDVSAESPFGLLRVMQQGLLQQHCTALQAADLLPDGADAPAAAAARLDALQLTAAARELGMVNIALGLWPAINAGYAQAYSRYDASVPVCGVGYAVVDETGQVRASTRGERGLWFASSSGIAPTAGIELVDGRDSKLAGANQLVASTRCWRDLWQNADARLRESIAATRASARIAGIPVLIVHGRADALIAVNHSSRPYVAAALQQGGKLRYYEIEHAQHFDALLGVPGMRAHIVAIHPYFLAALEQAWAHLRTAAELPPSQVVRQQPGTAMSAPGFSADPGANGIVFADGSLSVPE